MTTIARYKDTIYTDRFILQATTHGGISTELMPNEHKLFRHPSFPIIIGMSGSINPQAFQLVEIAINQMLTELIKDPHAPTTVADFDKIPTGEDAFTIILIAKEYTITIDKKNDKASTKWDVFKQRPDRLTIVGSGDCALKFLNGKAFEEDPEGCLRTICRMDQFSTVEWERFDISNLQELAR